MDNHYRIRDNPQDFVQVGVQLDLVVRYGREVLRGIHRGISRRPGWRLVNLGYHGFPMELPERVPEIAGFIGAFGVEDIPRIRGMFDGPVVGVSNRSRSLPCSRVVNDLPASAEMIFDYFHQRFYRAFCFVGMNPEADNYVCEGMWEAFSALALREGLACARTDPECLPKTLPSLHPGTAFVAYSDVEARRCLNILVDAGIRVPDDAAVLGVGDFELENMMSRVPLSTLRVNGERIGELAVEMLARELTCSSTLPGTLHVPPLGILERASTQTLYAEDQDLRDLLHMLRDEIPTLRTAGDCARLAGVGRRTLERRFQGAFGTGIAGILRFLRVEAAKRLMLEEDMKLEEVAERAGFADGRMLSVTFRKLTGENPSAFRKKYSGI